jgi:hypothetical protein
MKYFSIREIYALLISCSWPAVASGLYFLLQGKNKIALWYISIFSLVGLIVAVVFGIPSILLFNRFKLKSLFAFSIVGFFISVIIWAIFVIYPNFQRNKSIVEVFKSEPILIQSFIMFGICIFSSMLFWILARPDKFR